MGWQPHEMRAVNADKCTDLKIIHGGSHPRLAGAVFLRKLVRFQAVPGHGNGTTLVEGMPTDKFSN